MAAARRLASKLLQLQGNTNTHRLSAGTGVGALAGFFSAAAVASATSDGGSVNNNNNACPAYPWPQQDGARGGAKLFMQHDCAACHSMLPYAGLAAAAAGELEATAAEIVVVHEAAAHPEPAALHGGACTPDLPVIAKMLQGLRHSNQLYTADELRMALPAPVWLQFLQPSMRN